MPSKIGESCQTRYKVVRELYSWSTNKKCQNEFLVDSIAEVIGSFYNIPSSQTMLSF